MVAEGHKIVTKRNSDCHQGVENLIEELGKLYLKGSQYSAYEADEQFEKFCRLKSVNISNYVIEFELLYNKIKNFDVALPDDIYLAYKFLNNANISKQCKQLVCATVTELKYENMKDQIKKVFSDPINISSIVQNEQSIGEVEPTYYQETFYSSSSKCCPSERGSFNPRYRNNRVFDRTNGGRKFSKNLDRPTGSQEFVRKTNP